MQFALRSLAHAPLLSAVVVCLWVAQAAAQQGSTVPAVTAKIVETRISELEGNNEIDDETRESLLSLYQKALTNLEAEQAHAANTQRYIGARESARQEAKKLRDRLEAASQSGESVDLDLPKGATARQIDDLLQQERANRAAVSTKLKSLEQRLANQTNRPTLVRQRLGEAGARNSQLADELKAPPPPGQSALSTEARLWALSTEGAALAAEIRELDEELLSRPMRIDLMEAERETATRTLERMDLRIGLLEDALAEQRRVETEKAIAQADDAAATESVSHPLVTRYIERNRETGERLTKLTTKLEHTEATVAETKAQRAEVESNYAEAQERVDQFMSPSLGQILHQQRRELPDVGEYKRRRSKRREVATRTAQRSAEIRTELRETRNISSHIEDLLEEEPREEREEVAKALENLLSTRRTLLQKYAELNSKFADALGDLEVQEGRLIEVFEAFDLFLQEKLLWILSKPPVSVDSLRILPYEFGLFVAPEPWKEAAELLANRPLRSPFLSISLIAVIALLFSARSLRRALRGTSTVVGRASTDDFLYTAKALGYTILLAMPGPLLAYAVGWEFVEAHDAGEDVHAFGAGLLAGGRVLIFLSAARALFSRGGLAEAHFRWRSESVRALRRQTDLLLFTFLLPAFVLIVANERYPDHFGGEVGRLAFVVAVAGLAEFVLRLLWPTTGILHELLARSRRLSWLWVSIAMAVFLSVIVAALAGFLYSAVTITGRLIRTLWIILGLVVVHELVARWLLIVQQRLLLRAALERLEAARKERERELEESSEDVAVAIEEPEVDIASIDADTRMLLKTGLFLAGFILLGTVWSSVLPAFSFLQDYTLGSYLVGPSGEQVVVLRTLADFLLAILLAFLTYIGARSLPSLLEVVLRQRPSSTPGARLAYATLLRYAIVIAGVGAISSTIGFQWNKLQWLVAALGVGIGFGLQEIVANFISGLIILLERPIRVGDIVTVGDVSGTVTRLHIRATTVTNWDRQELLVPNKEFITQRVLNWSLSDEVIRLVMQVGVAYGSDMDKALRLVREAVEGHERVLLDPRPLVTFESFGDNSLNITARAFIDSLGNRRETVSDINLAINRTLNEAGITIAFPQRDVHFDTEGAIKIQIEPPGSPEAS